MLTVKSYKYNSCKFDLISDIRGFMTANGQPDNPRSARYILKDYVNGKLLYSLAPPDADQESYHTFPKSTNTKPRPMPPREMRAIKVR